MSATAVTLTLSPAVEALIKQMVASGRYTDANEVIAEGLRLLDERDKLERLRAAIAIGFEEIKRGESVLYTPELMDTLKREAADNVRRGKSIKDAVKPRDGR